MRVRVIPVIGTVRSGMRLDSMSGCHALHEHSVVRRFDGPGELGHAVSDALHEIALAQAALQRHFGIEDMSYLMRFES